MEVLKLLFDCGVPLTRLKEENGKISKVSEGRSLLQLVAASGCPEKGVFLIEKIMNAKNKFDKTNNVKKKETCKLGLFDHCEEKTVTDPNNKDKAGIFHLG